MEGEELVGVRVPGQQVRNLTIRGPEGEIDVVRDGELLTPAALITHVSLDFLVGKGDDFFPLAVPENKPILLADNRGICSKRRPGGRRV